MEIEEELQCDLPQKKFKQGLCQKKYLSKNLSLMTSQKKLFKVIRHTNKRKYLDLKNYREWLLKNKQYDYSKSGDITIKHY